MMLLALSALAQTPSVADWKVVETPHYRVHYPEPAEEWTLLQVERMESIRARVAEEVGWTPDFKVQVIVQDPYSEANGAVLPLGRSPRMILWTSPPGADSVIGNYRDWGELLVTHEDAHVVHLMKPPRGLSGQLMYSLFRLAPVTVKSPRWAIEGYATVVEGRLTDSGRPHAAYRGTLLRRLAQQGALPTYGEISGSERWQGYGYAYLVGSAYLEWLEARAGEGSLKALWARMTARKVRTFDQAFEGVFGESPVVLYKRFCAEVTRDAMATDGADWDRSTLWMDTSWSPSTPALSPNGEKLALVVTSLDSPTVLKVWKTAVDEEAVERWDEKVAQIRERDPEDVPGLDPATPPHETVLTFSDRTHEPSQPRWIDDTRLLFGSGRFDSHERYRRDLYVLDTESGRTRRVTDYADVRDGDPHPDGTKAVVVQGSWGRTGLSEVDLETGDVAVLTAPSARVVVDQPRYDDSGERLLYLRHAGAGFVPVVRDLATGAEQTVALPEGAAVIQTTWRGDAIVASLAVAGRIDLWRLPLEGEPERLTTDGAAFAPEPAADGLFFLQMQADGMEVHFHPDGPVHPGPSDDIGLVGPAPTVVPMDPVLSAIEPEALGIGRLEPRILVGGMVGQRASNFELGVRLGDIIGRNDLLVVGSLGDNGGTSGFAGWWVNRTLPGDLEVRVWGVQDGITPPWWLGGSVTVDLEGGNSVMWRQGRIGAWGELGTDGTQRAEGFVSGTVLVQEPRTQMFRIWAEGRASAGQDQGFAATLAEGSSGFSIGQTWRLGTEYTLGVVSGTPFSIGGVRSGLRAEEAQWHTLRNGWLAPQTAEGTVHDIMEWSLGSGGIDLMLERRRIWTPLGVTPYSLAGVRVAQSVDAQSLVRVPGVEIELGLGCAFEQGSIVERPCRKLDDYRTWSGIIWRP
ncbi:MAG: hypothetical protein R3F61_05340 [Myxococcota bacterium]